MCTLIKPYPLTLIPRFTREIEVPTRKKRFASREISRNQLAETISRARAIVCHYMLVRGRELESPMRCIVSAAS